MEQFERERAISNIASVAQKDLNSRLDGCYVRYVEASIFDGDAGKHDTKQISIVSRNGELEIWKGDIRIFLEGSGGEQFILLLVDSLTPST